MDLAYNLPPALCAIFLDPGKPFSSGFSTFFRIPERGWSPLKAAIIAPQTSFSRGFPCQKTPHPCSGILGGFLGSSVPFSEASPRRKPGASISERKPAGLACELGSAVFLFLGPVLEEFQCFIRVGTSLPLPRRRSTMGWKTRNRGPRKASISERSA